MDANGQLQQLLSALSESRRAQAQATAPELPVLNHMNLQAMMALPAPAPPTTTTFAPAEGVGALLGRLSALKNSGGGGEPATQFAPTIPTNSTYRDGDIIMARSTAHPTAAAAMPHVQSTSSEVTKLLTTLSALKKCSNAATAINSGTTAAEQSGSSPPNIDALLAQFQQQSRNGRERQPVQQRTHEAGTNIMGISGLPNMATNRETGIPLIPATSRPPPRITPSVIAELARMAEETNIFHTLRRLSEEQLEKEKSMLKKRDALKRKQDDESLADEIIGRSSSNKRSRHPSKELSNFDMYMWQEMRALWRDHQSVLESLSVPLMRVTDDPSEIALQKKVISVLLDMMPQ